MDENFEKFTITADATVKNTMKKMDSGATKTLIVVDKGGKKMVGVISDGDVRRHLLGNGELSDKIVNCYNKNPIKFIDEFEKEEARRIMLDRKIEAIPVVSKDNILKEIIFWDDIFDKRTKKDDSLVCPVIIMAGGKGTRLDPFTKILPKPLIPIGDTPIVEMIMDSFANFGVNNFSIVVNYKGEMIKSYFDNSEINYNISYIWEKEFAGTAGSLRLLPSDIDHDFIVSNCDIIIDMNYSDLMNFHRKNESVLTIVGSVQHHQIPYGVIEYTENGSVEKIIEKPEYDFTINTGLYVLNREALNNIPEGFFHITDLINDLIARGKKVCTYPVTEKSYVDTGQWEEYHDAIKKFGY